MSKVAITGNASGTGVFTVASPNSNVDRVLTLPDETGTVDTLQRSGNVIQVVNFQTGVMATGTTVIPADDTIPQITEGDEYMTLAITPTNATNKLNIAVLIGCMTRSVADRYSLALFRDAVANSLASSMYTADVAGYESEMQISHTMIAGGTSEITFRVRMGGHTAGTTTFNGQGAVRRHGGVIASSITITEYTA
jgi:hypothetical protein